MEVKTTTSNPFNTTQAITLAVVSLLLGVGAGWLIRRSVSTEAATTQVVSSATPATGQALTAPPNLGSMGIEPPQELKRAADTQAAPLLEQLKSDPSNAALLAKLGNIYYDTKQYQAAIDYYERSLKLQPSNASVRTDLGTAYWYSGNADSAIAQFNKALSVEPNKPDTLFNLGIVEWQGQNDVSSALATWQKLLDAIPITKLKTKFSRSWPRPGNPRQISPNRS